MKKRTRWVKESTFGIWFLNSPIWLKHVLNRAIIDLERLIPDRKACYPMVLDIGCGRGHSFSLLDERFSPERLHAIEIDKSLLPDAIRHAQQCRARVNVTQGNAETLPFADDSFDLLFCHQSFHHLVEHQQAMDEFYRVLKPGGIMLFAESCRKFIHSLIIRLLFKHPMAVQKTAQQYLQLIEDSGFDILPKAVSKPDLWWSRADLGTLEFFGVPLPERHEETLLNVVATKPV